MKTMLRMVKKNFRQRQIKTFSRPHHIAGGSSTKSAIHKASSFTVQGRSTGLPGIIPSGRSRISRGRGWQLPGGVPTYEFAKFSQKLHEIERILPPGGHMALPHPLISATDSCRTDKCPLPVNGSHHPECPLDPVVYYGFVNSAVTVVHVVGGGLSIAYLGELAFNSCHLKVHA